MPVIIEGGLGTLGDYLANASTYLGIAELVVKDVGKFFGTLSKALGPVGVAAATVEILTLEERARTAIDLGLLPESAIYAYEAILASHVTQATADPSLFGGEVVVQGLFDQWARSYGVPEYLKDNLRPDSMLRKVMGIGGQAPPGYKKEAPTPQELTMAPIDSSRPLTPGLTEYFNSTSILPPIMQMQPSQVMLMLKSMSEESMADYGPELKTLWEFRNNEGYFKTQLERYSNDKTNMGHLNADFRSLQQKYDESHPRASVDQSLQNTYSPSAPLPTLTA